MAQLGFHECSQGLSELQLAMQVRHCREFTHEEELEKLIAQVAASPRQSLDYHELIKSFCSDVLLKN